ncbi:MAG: metallophosphoesterase, partial [bacterium]
ALSENVAHNDYSDREEIHIDFLADLGDGWDSTYSLATLLAAPNLAFERDSELYQTQRGNILIMGGDEVYPTATREEYQNRLVGPYRSALPCVLDDDSAPHLYAIPGNHDWYDGLTAFTRLFMQRRWIGGWQTKQPRSYFALKLPHNWWLLGIDIQLASDIDMPQIGFFREVANQITPGDKVILCTAQPDWVHVQEYPEAFGNLAYFENEIVKKSGAELRLTLTGDLHHYCHYVENGGKKHKITSGGGGAYLYPTHEMPDDVALEVGDDREQYKLTESYPDLKTSRGLTVGAIKLPIRNWKFSMLLGGLYLIYAWIIQSASIGKPGGTFVETIIGMGIDFNGFLATLSKYFEILGHSPLGIVFFLLFVGGMLGFAKDEKWYSMPVGAVHGFAHVILNVFLAWLFLSFNFHIFNLSYGTFAHFVVYVLELIFVGSLLGGFLVGIYLYLVSRFLKLNSNEAFSCQYIADFKNFMRLHIDKNGELTVYPVGIERVCKEWELNKQAKDGESWFRPADGHTIVPRLIEKPIKIK